MRISSRLKRNWTNIILMCISILLSYTVLELSNYIITVSSDKYYVWPPGLQRTMYPDPNIVYGVSGEGNFTINSLGYRGPLIKDKEDEFRILAIGGSTTESMYHDDTEAWPYLLMQHLNRTADGRKVIVLNAGQSGLATREHILQVRHLSKMHDVNLIMVLSGCNDVMLHLGRDNNIEKADAKKDYSKAFYYSPHFTIRSTLTYKIGRAIYFKLIINDRIQRPDGTQIYDWRHARIASQIINITPDYRNGLDDYASNIRLIIQYARANGVPIVFLTQPHLWKQNMTKLEEESLSMTRDYAGKYYSASVMKKIMDEYNSKLMAICKTEEVYCFDLSARVPQNLTFFYDDVHFTEEGQRKIATEIAHFLTTGTEFNFSNP